MLRFAIRNLLSRPVRSLLSLLGLTVAIVGMVGLFSVAEGIDATVDETFGQIPGILVMQELRQGRGWVGMRTDLPVFRI